VYVALVGQNAMCMRRITSGSQKIRFPILLPPNNFIHWDAFLFTYFSLHFTSLFLIIIIIIIGRSQWPRGLRRRSTVARVLRPPLIHSVGLLTTHQATHKPPLIHSVGLLTTHQATHKPTLIHSVGILTTIWYMASTMLYISSLVMKPSLSTSYSRNAPATQDDANYWVVDVLNYVSRHIGGWGSGGTGPISCKYGVYRGQRSAARPDRSIILWGKAHYNRWGRVLVGGGRNMWRLTATESRPPDGLAQHLVRYLLIIQGNKKSMCNDDYNTKNTQKYFKEFK
jgi:hypothetical protein